MKDSSGAKLETWTMNIADKKTASKVMKILKERWNFEPESFSKKIKDEKDLKWLRDDSKIF